MMVISDIQLKKFQELYKTELGLEISRDEAFDKALKLLHMMELIYHPLTSDELEEIENERIAFIESLQNNLLTKADE
jgi:hypothetical protein